MDVSPCDPREKRPTLTSVGSTAVVGQLNKCRTRLALIRGTAVAKKDETKTRTHLCVCVVAFGTTAAVQQHDT